MSPTNEFRKPRRSKRQQGIELSSDVGLRTHRRRKNENVIPDKEACIDVTENEVPHQEQENEVAHQEQVNVTDVLGTDLAEEEDDVQHNTQEEAQVEEDEVQQPEEVAAEQDGVNEAEAGLPSTEEVHTQPSNTKKKKSRGPTRMRKIAKHHDDKVEVEFTSLGEHVGDDSVTLSSFLGPLVREHVPVLLDDWRHLPDQTRDTLWEEIQGRFNLKEDWQKECVFKQMGCLWRASKSRLVSLVRETTSKTKLLNLKPSNIPSVTAWTAWVKRKNSSAFKVKSDKYRELRKAQIPHTTSRKGMTRLAYEMKKKSTNPKTVTRSKVWVARHTHSDGRPVRPEFAETIEKIKSIDSEMDSTATTNLKEDAVSQVLGKDKPGRLRGMGRGVTATKLAFLLARDAHVEKLEAKQADLLVKIEDLQNVVSGLAGKKNQSEEGSKSDATDVSKGVRCQLLDWCSDDDVVVGEGEFCSAEPMYKIGRIPIGPNAAAVYVKSVSNEKSFLWRPTPTIISLGQAVGVKIAWPFDKIILDSDSDYPTENKTANSSAIGGNMDKIHIYDWNLMDTLIAEGRLCSTDPKELVNNIPLGPNAAIVMVEKVFNKESFLWRPSAEMSTMADALHENIAWPIHYIQLVNLTPTEESPDKQPSPLSLSTTAGSTSKSLKKKCILLDCSNSREKIVAEGKVLSANPSDVVHFVPLGPNASKVMVEVAKVGDARVWRPNSEIETIADAIGTTVAWPNDKLMFL